MTINSPVDGHPVEAPNMKTPPSPKELQEAVVEKEHGDVVSSLNSIEATLTGIQEKTDKLMNTKDNARRKMYKAQIKSSEKYLESLYDSLKLEMREYIREEYRLEKGEY